MIADSIISTDRQAREVKAAIEEIDTAVSSKETLDRIVEGLPINAVEGVNKALRTERQKLAEMLDLYNEAKSGNGAPLIERSKGDLGTLLIAARVAKGLTQQELAQQLGLKMQAVQRYEAEKYRSISLANFQKFISVLGVNWTINVETTLKERFGLTYQPSQLEIRKILKHARSNGWLKKSNESDDSAIAQIRKTVADHVVKHGTPSLLRTGLNVLDHSEDWSLLAWKAQVTLKAEEIIQSGMPDYSPLNVKWVLDLAKLSADPAGPRKAVDFLKERGIVLIVEPPITGLKIDGAAFLADSVPIVGLTLRRDSIDNFWFSLMHEVAHVILHYRTGLASGFFDNFGEEDTLEDIEQEANDFAGNILIPAEKWRRSPARISTNPSHIKAFADALGIHPAIVFGRIQMERNNYAIFSNKIGRGAIRKQFFNEATQ